MMYGSECCDFLPLGENAKSGKPSVGTFSGDLKRIRAARPFYFRRGKRGCLLLHGISSTPFAVLELGRELAKRGVTVYAPLIAGHGRTWKHLERTSWQEWYLSVEEAYFLLRKKCAKVFAAGLSMGGAQVLHLAAHHPELDGVAAMAPALYLNDWRIPVVLALRKLVRTVPPVGDSIEDPASPREICYPRLPSRSLLEMVRMMRHVREDLPFVRCPAIFMGADRDKVVPPGNARFAFDRVSSVRKRIFRLPGAGHVMTMDRKRQRVFELIARFVGSGV